MHPVPAIPNHNSSYICKSTTCNKDVIIKRLQNENVVLSDRCSKLEQKLVEFECPSNNVEQYGRRNNIIISGIPDSVDVAVGRISH